ncbi:MAG: tetratricopeptide repeat protein, partial [Chloroflexi bacterium]|nr:tetratricopeptide repeat protein [Chloroflexota bacterium]
DKLTLVRSIALVMVGAWLIKWLEERKSDRTRADRVTWRTPLVLPTLILVGLYLVTSVLSLVPRVSFMGSYQRLQGTYSTFSYIVIFCMLLLNMRRREQLDRLVTAAVITSLPIAFYGLLQHGDGTTSIDPLPWGGDVTSRVASNMGNAIFVAAYLIMAFFLTLGRIIDSFRVILTEKESRLSDILRASSYVFIGAVQLIAFGFADSRGPLLGWLPGMFIFGLVGLLLLRVSLHSQAADETDLTEVRFPIKALDVVKALGVSVFSIAGAAAGAFLVFKLFPVTKISLVVVAALLGGLLPLLIVAGIRRAAARWLWASWIFFSVVGAVGLFLVNFSDMPLVVELRTSGAFGRLSALFETEGGTGEVRSLIWEGAAKLVLPHDPLKFPDGSVDSLNFARPLIGYGPESMYVAYNPFYPPDLAHLEARNASPDRSHNEVWDSLVITGGAGFVVEQFLFLSVFFFALKFIGWIPGRRAAWLLIGLMVAAGIAGAALLAFALQPNFFGPGWTGGVTGGLVLYVITFALFHFQVSRRVYIIIAAILIGILDFAIYFATFTSTNRVIELAVATGGGLILFGALFAIGRAVFGRTAGQPIEMSGHLFLIIALFGGILAHYLEIGLAGIAIASTRTYFWTYAALLVLTGLKWVPVDEEAPKPAVAPVAVAPAAPVSREPANTPRYKKKTVQRGPVAPVTTRREPRRATPWLSSVLMLALIGTLVLSTLGYEFITSSTQNQSAPVTSATQLIVNSLTRLPYQNNRESLGALLMFFVTWLFGGLLSITELRRRNVLAAKDVLPAAGVWYGTTIGLALTFWLIHAGTLLSLGSIIQGTQITTLDQYAQRVNELLKLAETVSGLLTTFYFVVLLLMLGIAVLSLNQTRTWLGKAASDWGLAASIPVVIVVIVLVVTTNLNSIRADTIYKQADPLRQQGQWDVAIAHYKRVLELAPDEDFYYLWLGAAYLEKASQAPEGQSILATTGNSLAGIVKLTFQQTYSLSKQDSLLAAKTVLDNARTLNPLNTDHSANLARLHRRWADLYAADPVVRKTQLDQSAAQYQIATTLSPNNAILWNEWSTVLMALADSVRAAGDAAGADAFITDAQAKLDHSLALDQQFEQTYLIRAQLARSQGQTDAARREYEMAMKWNPNSTDAWGGLADMLVSQGNYTEVETITLGYLQKQPDFLPALRTLARNVYFPQNRLAEALATQQRVVQLAASDPNLWDDQRVLAILLAQSGQIDLALQTAQQALAGAPEANKAEINSLITQLQGSLGITAPVTPTTP